MDLEKRRSCKIVVLGNSGVGKTSLVMQWTTGDFEAQTGPTIGANHQRKSILISGEEVDLFLWDTAGQEQFQALTPLYAHSAATALLVVAIDEIESFKGIPTWTDLLSQSCDKSPPIILVVNKVDHLERAALAKEDIKARYNKTFQAICFVSAVTGEGVDAAFLHAGELAYRFTLESANAARQPVQLAQSGKTSACC
jgi:small GTP-binding protein